jgi:hypothetical protein
MSKVAVRLTFLERKSWPSNIAGEHDDFVYKQADLIVHLEQKKPQKHWSSSLIFSMRTDYSMQIPIGPERPAHRVSLDTLLNIDRVLHLVLRVLSSEATGTI